MQVMKSRADWLKKRTSYIGGSDASAIVGMNPYKTNVELWEEKTGRRKPEDIGNKDFVIYGTKAEEHLRELFKLDFPQYEVGYIENNIWLNEKHPFGHASLDGWLTEKETGRRGVFECKTTNILQSIQREKWNNRIPDNYYIQVLHYLLITEFDFVILKAQLRYDYNGEIYLNTKHYTIERADVEDDIEFLREAEQRFAEYIKKGIKPPLILPSI